MVDFIPGFAELPYWEVKHQTSNKAKAHGRVVPGITTQLSWGREGPPGDLF
jgi:hypothetical protein